MDSSMWEVLEKIQLSDLLLLDGENIREITTSDTQSIGHLCLESDPRLIGMRIKAIVGLAALEQSVIG